MHPLRSSEHFRVVAAESRKVCSFGLTLTSLLIRTRTGHYWRGIGSKGTELYFCFLGKKSHTFWKLRCFQRLPRRLATNVQLLRPDTVIFHGYQRECEHSYCSSSKSQCGYGDVKMYADVKKSIPMQTLPQLVTEVGFSLCYSLTREGAPYDWF